MQADLNRKKTLDRGKRNEGDLNQIMNTVRIVILFVALTISGCNPDDDIQGDPTQTSVPEKADDSLSRQVEAVIQSEESHLQPLYPAELFIESRDMDSGTFRFTSSIHSERHSEKIRTVDKNLTSESTRWESSKSKITVTMADKSECVFIPKFIESKDGKDIWEVTMFELIRTNGQVRQKNENTLKISFDGKSEMKLIDETDRLVIFRKNSYTPENLNNISSQIGKNAE